MTFAETFMRRAMRLLLSSGLTSAALSAALAASRVHAQTVTLTPAKDNSIFSDFPNHSNGHGTSLFVGHNLPDELGGGRRRSLIAFDLVGGGVPVGATIQSASFSMFFEQGGNGFGAGQTHSLHRLLDDWGEGDSVAGGGQGVAAAPGDATWLHRFFDDRFWAIPGGDFAPTPSASLFVTNEPGTLMTWGSTPDLVADVQTWADAPTCSFGWLVIGDEQGNRTAARFTSRDNTFLPANHPKLAVEFTPPRPRLDGDLDFDGDVDREDVAHFTANIGLNPCGTMNDGDFTTDGLVGLADLGLLQSHLGLPPPPSPIAVPEPRTSLLLNALTPLILAWAYRRRGQCRAA